MATKESPCLGRPDFVYGRKVMLETFVYAFSMVAVAASMFGALSFL